MQVEFNLLEAEAQFGVAMDGLSVESFEVSPGTAMDDYYLVLGHAGRRIAGRLEYNAELFAPATAQRFAADWQVREMALEEGILCKDESPLLPFQWHWIDRMHSDTGLNAELSQDVLKSMCRLLMPRATRVRVFLSFLPNGRVHVEMILVSALV